MTSDHGARLLVSTRKGLFVMRRAEAGFTIESVSFLGAAVTMALADPRDGSMYAAVGHGHFGAKLHRSRDGGSSWEEIAAPKYPEKPEGEDDRDPMRGTPVSWSLDQIWSLEAGGADEPGVLWCGTIPGGLFRSADSGASWSMIRSLWDDPRRRSWFAGGYDAPGIHSICVDPRDARHVTVGVSCGGVWVTRDSGATWQLQADGMYAVFMPPERKFDPTIQDPHRVVQCVSSPDCLWAQHHCAVFRSTDGGRSWTDVPAASPSGFGFAVAVHPKDPEIAWFVPAVKDEQRVPVDGKVVVSRTRDGGKTFDVLRRGLPQEHAYDLVYRHALDVDASGDRLVMGSTTGSLWTSDDQGDSWQVVSHHLPPVYCARFIA